MVVSKRSNHFLLVVLQLALLYSKCISYYTKYHWLTISSLVAAHSQVIWFSCQATCPGVLTQYDCRINSSRAKFTITGKSVSGTTLFRPHDPVGQVRRVGRYFNATKTDNNAFTLDFIAEVKYNDKVTVECTDMNDNSDHNSKQCPIVIKGNLKQLYLVKHLSILSTDPPSRSPHSLSYLALNTTSVVISWSSIWYSYMCVDYYRVNLSTPLDYQLIDTMLTYIIINDIEQGRPYTYNVAAVDGGDRSGPQSYTRCFSIDCKLFTFVLALLVITL